MKKIQISPEFLEDIMGLSAGDVELYRDLKKYPYTPDERLVAGIRLSIRINEGESDSQQEILLKLKPEDGMFEMSWE